MCTESALSIMQTNAVIECASSDSNSLSRPAMRLLLFSCAWAPLGTATVRIVRRRIRSYIKYEYATALCVWGWLGQYPSLARWGSNESHPAHPSNHTK